MENVANQETLSVIIVNYNTGNYLMGCVRSLTENTPDFPLEVIIVDNASTDDSIRQVSEAFQDIKIVINSRNLGFAAACNQGIGQARGQTILLLNPDTIIPGSAVKDTLAFLTGTPEAGIVGCRLVDSDGRPRVSSRAFPTVWNYLSDILFSPKLLPGSKSLGRFHLTKTEITEPVEVDMVSGAFFMFKRAVTNAIGLLDERYFIYTEERDFCYRAQEAGWKIYFFPQASVIHIGGISTRQQAVEMQIELKKSMIRFHQKFDSRRKAGLIRLLIFLAVFARFLVWSVLAALKATSDAGSRRCLYAGATRWFFKRNGAGELSSLVGSK